MTENNENRAALEVCFSGGRFLRCGWGFKGCSGLDGISGDGLWGRPEATAGWRGHRTSYTMGFSGLREELQWKDESFPIPSAFPLVGIMPHIFPSPTSRQTSNVSRQDGGDRHRENPASVDSGKSLVDVNGCGAGTLDSSPKCSKSQFADLCNGGSKNTCTS